MTTKQRTYSPIEAVDAWLQGDFHLEVLNDYCFNHDINQSDLIVNGLNQLTRKRKVLINLDNLPLRLHELKISYQKVVARAFEMNKTTSILETATNYNKMYQACNDVLRTLRGGY